MAILQSRSPRRCFKLCAGGLVSAAFEVGPVVDHASESGRCDCTHVLSLKLRGDGQDRVDMGR